MTLYVWLLIRSIELKSRSAEMTVHQYQIANTRVPLDKSTTGMSERAVRIRTLNADTLVLKRIYPVTEAEKRLADRGVILPPLYSPVPVRPTSDGYVRDARGVLRIRRIYEEELLEEPLER